MSASASQHATPAETTISWSTPLSARASASLAPTSAQTAPHPLSVLPARMAIHFRLLGPSAFPCVALLTASSASALLSAGLALPTSSSALADSAVSPTVASPAA